MKILMISLDNGLLGQGELGDVVLRHKKYGEHVDALDIIVFANQKSAKYKISNNVTAYPVLNSGRSFSTSLKAIKLGKKLIEKNRYDLIVTQDVFFTGLAGLRLKSFCRAKLLVHLHGDFIDNKYWLKENWKNHILKFVANHIIKQADGIRVMSQFQKEKLLSKNIPENKVRVISTPVDIDRFDKTSDEDALNKFGHLLPWGKVALMVGRKDPVKDFDTLFKAMGLVFEKFDDVGLWLVGNFTNHDDIPLPKERLVLSGQVSTEDIQLCYKLATVVVLSSTSESFGKVLVEANACAKPLVATATTGANEIIRHGENGLIVPIKDNKKLADEVLYLLNHPKEAIKMGEKGREMVKNRYMGNTQKIVNYWMELVKQAG